MWLFVFVETGSHVAQDGFQFNMQPRMTLRFFSPFKDLVFSYVHMSVRFMHVSAGAQRSQKGESDPLELQLVVSYPMWILGAKFRSSERPLHMPNCLVISPAPRP